MGRRTVRSRPQAADIVVLHRGGESGRDAAALRERLADPDTVVELMETRGHGLAHVLHTARVPVAIPPAGYAATAPDELRVIAVGFDGEPESLTALRLAERAALAHSATLRVYAAVPRNDWSALEGIHDTLDERLRREVETLDSGVRAAAAAVAGDPVRVLEQAAREGADLLVVGSHGRGRLGRLLLGSVSCELAEHVECPLLVVPALARGAAAPAEAAA